MTSDAKIGLLLGLVFIFIIAFIINGLPTFNKDTQSSNNELTNRMVSLKDGTLGIAQKEREMIKPKEPLPQHSFPVQPPQQDGSPQAQLSQPPVAANQADKPENIASQPLLADADKQELPDVKINQAQTVSQNIYVVCDGDSLASIAQKYYGVEEGNKKANITKIFEANRNQIKSADEIYIGQKIIIPPLQTSAQNKGNMLSNPMLEEVKSVGQRHLPAENRKTEQPNKLYVVQENDSLWQIAAKQFGDGNRYREIIKLNTDILKNEDTLSVGMRLKMPDR